MQVSEWTINIQVVGVVAIVCIVLGYVVAAEFYRKRLCRVAIQLDISREGNKDIMLQLSTLQSQLKDTEIRSDELKAETRQLREQLQSVSDSRHRLLVELNGRKVEVGLVRQELTQVREKQTKSKIIEFSPELISAKKLVIPETKHVGINLVTSVDDTEELTQVREQQHELGQYYANLNNYTKAAGWYKKAAEQGHPKAQYSIGLMYAKGLGVSKNIHVAIDWYHKSASQGNSDAQLILGLLYWQGDFLPQNKDRAISWYCKSASQGNVLARNRVRDAAKDGNDIANAWLRKNSSEKYSGQNLSSGKNSSGYYPNFYSNSSGYHDEEERLIAEEADDYSASMARSDDDGWFYED